VALGVCAEDWAEGRFVVFVLYSILFIMAHLLAFRAVNVHGRSGAAAAASESREARLRWVRGHVPIVKAKRGVSTDPCEVSWGQTAS
jgi:hypothetical protein